MDQSDTGSTGIFSRRANRIIHHGTGTPEGYGRAPNCEAAPAPPAGGPIGRRKHGYILTMDQSDAESTSTPRLDDGRAAEGGFFAFVSRSRQGHSTSVKNRRDNQTLESRSAAEQGPNGRFYSVRVEPRFAPLGRGGPDKGAERPEIGLNELLHREAFRGRCNTPLRDPIEGGTRGYTRGGDQSKAGAAVLLLLLRFCLLRSAATKGERSRAAQPACPRSLVPPSIGPRPGYILLSLLRSVPAP
eukprot:1183281-Prorocentrum_minimum.AAC.1